MKKFYIYCLLLIATPYLSLFVSCNKVEISDIKDDGDSQLIAEAKDNYEKYVSQITKSQVNYVLSWDCAIVVKYENIAINIEIPLTDFKIDSITIYQDSNEIKCVAESRLIARKSPNYNKYTYFIVSRAWIDGKHNLAGKKLDDRKSNSVTQVHSLEGKLINEFSTIGSDIRNKTRCNDIGTNLCISCGYNNFESSTKCHYCKALLIKDVHVISNHIMKLIEPIWNNFRRAVTTGKMYHDINSENGCYGTCCTIRDVAINLPYHFEYRATIITTLPINKIDYPIPTISYDECREIYMHFPLREIDILAFAMKSPSASEHAKEVADNYCRTWFENQLENGNNPMENACPHEKCHDCGKCLNDDPTTGCILCGCCRDEKCSICHKCIVPSRGDCAKCVCPCGEPKCPICGKCFRSNGYYPLNKKCRYCEGTEKDLHLLQDSIMTKCPYASDIFSIRNQFLGVVPFYKWESVELSLVKMRSVALGLSVCTTVEGSSYFRLFETDGATMSGNQIGLPRDLLVNRNTDRLSTTFFHEIFHSNQAFNFLTAKANAEIEAKLAELIYAQQAGISQENTEANLDFHNALCKLKSYINKNTGYVESSCVSLYHELYEDLLDFISKTFNYPKDNAINGNLSLQTLRSFL